MKILVLGINSWDNRNAVGNTLSNWFEGWNDCEFAFMYTRSTPPNNSCSNNYYQITLFDIIRNIFTPSKIGRSFVCEAKSPSVGSTVENVVIRKSSTTVGHIIKKCIGLSFSTGIWFNQKTKNYVRDFNPDIVFTFVLGDAFRTHILNFVKTETKAKIVEFVADDVWGQLADFHSIYQNSIRKRILTQFKLADKIYGASKELCEKYAEDFNIKISPLYKGARISPVKDNWNIPITIVYAGNLHYGRDITLTHLADAVAQLNQENILIKLEIYSNSHLSDGIIAKLNDHEYGCHLFDIRPYEDIKRIMSSSDIVLHVESFRKEDIGSVKYSFSTKIMDCLQSGSVMMTIGPEGNASIEYPKAIPGTIVVTDLSKIKDALNDVINNPESLCQRAKLTNDFAEKFHNIDTLRTNLHMEFNNLINNRH